jgi:hypothetical protein
MLTDLTNPKGIENYLRQIIKQSEPKNEINDEDLFSIAIRIFEKAKELSPKSGNIEDNVQNIIINVFLPSIKNFDPNYGNFKNYVIQLIKKYHISHIRREENTNSEENINKEEIEEYILSWESNFNVEIFDKENLIQSILSEFDINKHPAYIILRNYYLSNCSLYYESQEKGNIKGNKFFERLEKVEKKIKNIYYDFDENLKIEFKKYLKEEEINYLENEGELKPYEINSLFIIIISFISIYVPPKIEEMIKKIRPTNRFPELMQHAGTLYNKFISKKLNLYDEILLYKILKNLTQ